MPAQLDLARWMWLTVAVVPALALGVLAGVDPELAIGVALGCAFAFIALSDLAAGLALVGLLASVVLIPLSLSDGVARLVLALSWLALIATRQRRELEFWAVHPAITAILIAFLAWATLSVTWAESTSEAFRSAGQYLLSVIMLMIVFTGIRSRENLSWLLSALVLGAATAGVYGMLTLGPEQGGRLESNLLDANLLAASLVAGSALSVAVVFLHRSPIIRIGAVTASALCIAGVWMTASRAGLIALGTCVLAAVLLSGRWRPHVLVAGAGLALVTIVYFGAFASDETRERIAEPNQGQARLEDGRTTIWQVAGRIVDDEPVTGIAAGNFSVAARHYLFEPGTLARSDLILEEPQVAHNSLLQVLTELGIVGLAMFIAVLGFCFGSLLQAGRLFRLQGNEPMQAASICVTVALVGVLTVQMFHTDHYNIQLWLLLGLGPALLAIAQGSAAGEESTLATGARRRSTS